MKIRERMILKEMKLLVRKIGDASLPEYELKYNDTVLISGKSEYVDGQLICKFNDKIILKTNKRYFFTIGFEKGKLGRLFKSGKKFNRRKDFKYL